MDVSKSVGTPSMEEEELVNCSGVASAFERNFNPVTCRGILRGLGE
jgi:hypothetical protein